jgi:hypothetical protein
MMEWVFGEWRRYRWCRAGRTQKQIAGMMEEDVKKGEGASSEWRETAGETD